MSQLSSSLVLLIIRFWLALICILGFGVLAVGAASLKGRDNPANLVGHGGPIKAVAISSDGRFALSGSFDYSAVLWRLDGVANKKLVRRYSKHDGAVNAVAFVEGQNKFISAGDDGSLYLWDLNSDQLLYRFKGHLGKVLSVAVSKNGKIAASASWDRTVRLWDLKNKQQLQVFEGHKGPVNAVLISQDNKFVYSGSYDGTITKWNIKTGKKLRAVHSHGWGINVMKWLPNQQQILFGAINGDVQIYDLLTGKIAKILIPHERPVLALAVSSDGEYLASGGGDGVIRVWGLSNWSMREELFTASGPVWSMDFSHDNKKIYYAGLDDFVVGWSISPRKVGSEAQGKFPRRFQKYKNMTLGERQFARKCSVCHTLKAGSQNRAGPSLFGLFGRVAGTLKGYKYSDGLLKSEIIWNEHTIDQLFDLGPQHVTPGSKMPLQMIGKKHKRDALIKFLKINTQ